MSKQTIYFVLTFVTCFMLPLIAADQVFVSAPITLDSVPVRVTFFNFLDSPVYLSQVQQIKANEIYQMVLENKSDKDIEKILLSGFTFQQGDISMITHGGFSKGIMINLRSGNKKAIEINLKLSDGNQISSVTDVIIFTSKVHFSNVENYFGPWI
jgi:hypothetical protein